MAAPPARSVFALLLGVAAFGFACESGGGSGADTTLGDATTTAGDATTDATTGDTTATDDTNAIGCRSDDDCADGTSCLGPNQGPGCGASSGIGCYADSDCGVDERCQTVTTSCTTSGFGSECAPPCTSDTECSTDFECVDGLCEAILCDAGYTCPSHQMCDAGSVDGSSPPAERDHGCRDVACIDDEDCDPGVCVSGVCQTGPGTCEGPRP